jgi:hypothetical protein
MATLDTRLLTASQAKVSCTAALRLPTEIVKAICDDLPNSTIKNLRLTCRFFSNAALLRFTRVFISANPRNINVFTRVANHQVYQHEVIEIIWDDATLFEGSQAYRNEMEDEDADEDDDSDGVQEDGINSPGSVPKWFRQACKDNISDLESLKDRDADRLGHIERAKQVAAQMPVADAWACYKELLSQQRQVLQSQSHIRALEDGIGLFPKLRRVTITPAAHGRLFNPLYKTPMIRAFPLGFNYHIPRGWPITADGSEPECPKWNGCGSDWQGFRVVTRVLAENRGGAGERVTQLRVDSHALETGLNARVFEKENSHLANFEAVVGRPGFGHLHLDLMVDPHNRQAAVFRRGLLRRALAGAALGQGLEHLSLRTNVELHRGVRRYEWYVPLKTIFAPSTLSRLQHFSLSRFYVKEDDLIALLGSMPRSLRTLELSFLEFMDDEGSHRNLLEKIRDSLGWREWAPRPQLTMAVSVVDHQPQRGIWITEEVDDFLYRDGTNPFGDDSRWGIGSNRIRKGFGLEKDAFDPEHERPHVDRSTLTDLGYLKTS